MRRVFEVKSFQYTLFAIIVPKLATAVVMNMYIESNHVTLSPDRHDPNRLANWARVAYHESVR